MSDSMVDTVARAIEDAVASDNNGPDDLARAAMCAIRKPTEAMGLAGGESLENTDCHAPDDMAREAFTAMIDAALAIPRTEQSIPTPPHNPHPLA